MRIFSEFQPLNRCSERKHLNFLVSRCQITHLSTLSNKPFRLSNLKKPKGNQFLNPTKTGSSSSCSLFNEIANILGADSFVIDKTPSGFLLSGESAAGGAIVREECGSSTQGVCGNAEENVQQETGDMLVLEETQLKNAGGTDISPRVRTIVEIVRDEHGAAAMEERLENLGFVFDAEIVEKVLKRCFKVPHMALKFFNWVKLQNGFRHTTGTYNTMMCIAVEARESELVERLVGEMEKHSCAKNIRTWTILISGSAKLKSVGKALLTFEMMRRSGCEPDLTAYKVMISSLCIGGKADIAMEMYKEMVDKGMEVRFSLYRMLMNCLAKSGDIAAVRLIADDMTRLSEIEGTVVYDCMLKSLCISGRIKEALELIRDLISKNITLDGGYFQTLVKGLCSVERVADALEIVNIMERKNIIDGKVYGAIISAYLKRNDVPQALDLLCSTVESGHLLPASTYTELMQHLFRLNDYQKGCELFNDMVAQGIEPDSVAITALFAGHVRHNHISEAWEVFESMEKKGIRATWKSYSVFIKELCKMSMTDEIMRVLNRMQASKITIGNEIFHCITTYLVKKGDTKTLEKVKQIQRNCQVYPQGNEELVADVPTKYERDLGLIYNRTEPRQANTNSGMILPEACNDQVLEELCTNLKSQTDWWVTQEALEKYTGQCTPSLVVEVLRRCGMHGNAALQFFSWVGRQDGYSHTSETYNMAIKVSGQGKDFKHMRSLFSEMKRKGVLVTSETWTIMIMQYGRTGLTDTALTTFRNMKASGCTPTKSTYKYLIVCLCGNKGRNVDEAIKTFKEMIRAGYIPDKELVETYLDCLCEADKLSDARRCAESLHEVGFSIPLGYSLYIRALCRARRLDEALSLLGKVKAEQPILDKYVYGSIVHGLLQVGRFEDALAKMNAMKQEGINPTVHVYTSLMDYFFKEKQVERALEIFKTMKAEGCEPTVITYSALIRGYMNNENVAAAWDVFNGMKSEGPYPDYKTYSLFIALLCKVGKSEEALQLLSEMMDSRMVPSSVNFRTVIYGLNTEGKHSLAQKALQKKKALTSKRKFLA